MKTKLFLALSAFFFVGQAMADAHFADRWVTIDDESGEPKSIVQITESQGNLMGKVVKLLPAAEDKICTACKGERKDKPIEGMVVMWGFEKYGDMWKKGTILDPKTGKEYRSQLTLKDNGEKLKVRGYVGFSWIGRSQVWIREGVYKKKN